MSSYSEPSSLGNTLLDNLVPGYGLAHRYLLETLGLDIATFIPAIIAAWLLNIGVPKIYKMIVSLVESHFMSQIAIDERDDYEKVMDLLMKSPSIETSHNLECFTYYPSHKEFDKFIRSEKNVNNESLNFSELELNFPPRFTPNYGLQSFRYKNRWFQIARVRRIGARSSYGGGNTETETLTIFCLGRSPDPIKALIDDARRSNHMETQCVSFTSPAIKQRRSHGTGWGVTKFIPLRELNTVVLHKEVKENIIADIQKFLRPDTMNGYTRLGTGKSSLALAMAGRFTLPVYFVPLSSRNVSEEDLRHMFDHLPPRAIVIFEEVDAVEILPVGDGVSVRGLLNIIDGPGAHEGHILILTTNHLSKLDEALTRPGRVDYKVEFTLADSEQIKDLFTLYYGYKGAKEFASKIPNNRFSSAQIQGFLLSRRDDPDKALTEISAWVEAQKISGS